MGDPPIDYVCAEAVVNFLQGRGALSATWLLKYRVLSGLYRFAIGRGHVDKSPWPVAIPKLPLQQTPYVYSNDELRRLDATTTLHVAHSPLRAPMYRSLLLLLYDSGLRIGEALRLTLRDVDLDEGVITFHDTKFCKSRLVPVGPKLAQVGRLCRASTAASIVRRGIFAILHDPGWARGCSYQAINIVFQRLRRAAGIVCPPGESKPPRFA
jgi:integrase/recombinase XerD